MSFFHFMLKNNIYIAPSAYESGFVSSSHSYKDLDDFSNTVKLFLSG